MHFGAIITMNMEIGMTELTIAVWPWLLSVLAFLVLVTYRPPLSIWLPRTLGLM